MVEYAIGTSGVFKFQIAVPTMPSSYLASSASYVVFKREASSSDNLGNKSHGNWRWKCRHRLPKKPGRNVRLVVQVVNSDGFPADSLRTDPEIPQTAKDSLRSKKKRLIAGVDQSMLVDPWLLADPDSRFAEFQGVQVHHKIARPQNLDTSLSSTAQAAIQESKLKIPAILLHGFGASLFSWERVMTRLANCLGTDVLAFDRPAFGLTSRAFVPRRSKSTILNPYSAAFSAAVTLAFVNFLHADQAILIGHSAGCLVALDVYFKAPEKVAALILVAPAVAAPLFVDKFGSNKREGSSSEDSVKNGRIWGYFSKACGAISFTWSRIVAFFRAGKLLLREIYKRLLREVLLSPPAVWLARIVMNSYGPKAVRLAFYDPEKADKYVIDGYTKPLQCRDWEKALLEYVAAVLDMSKGRERKSRGRLEDISCPVLVVTGDTDRLVPAWNARRLAKVFKRSEFKLIKNCGHLPQEETPEELVNIVLEFVTQLSKSGEHQVEDSPDLVEDNPDLVV